MKRRQPSRSANLLVIACILISSLLVHMLVVFELCLYSLQQTLNSFPVSNHAQKWCYKGWSDKTDLICMLKRDLELISLYALSSFLGRVPMDRIFARAVSAFSRWRTCFFMSRSISCESSFKASATSCRSALAWSSSASAICRLQSKTI